MSPFRHGLISAVFPAVCLFLLSIMARGAGAPPVPILEPFEPAQDEALINFHPHFQWKGPEMALDYQPECEIQVATEPTFENIVATDVIGGGMNRYYAMRSLTEKREYFWRVRLIKPETGPWSKISRFTVVAPERQFLISKGSDSLVVLDTLRKAAAYGKTGHSAEVVFEKGDYALGPVAERFAFRVDRVKGFRIEGNGSTITMSGKSFFAEVSSSQDIEFRQLTMKWDTPGHLMLEVKRVYQDTREIEAVIPPQYGTQDLEVYWPVKGGNTFCVKVDPRFPGKTLNFLKSGTPRRRISEGVYRIGPIAEKEFHGWQAGDRLAATCYKRGGFIQNHDNEKLVLKDVTLVDSPSALSGGGGRNSKFAYLNVDVVPDPRLPDSRIAGHASSEGGRIAAWIEQCDFNMLADDNYNTGYFFDYELLGRIDAVTLTMKLEPWDELIEPGDRLRFMDQKTNVGLCEAVAVSVSGTGLKNQVKVSFDRELPRLPVSTIASNNHGTQRYVYRHNRQIGGRAHGLKFKGYGALIEHNLFENITGVGIYLGCAEGDRKARSADMVTVRHNIVSLCGSNSIEAGQVAARSERLRFEDNLIRDAKKVGISLVNVHGALVRGNTFDSVTDYFQPTYRYVTVVTTGCTDVRISDEIIKDARARGTREASGR
jgi:hypothetical protein